jgi:hypothetical protein
MTARPRSGLYPGSRRTPATASQQRDDLIDQRDDVIDQRDTARAQTARAQENAAPSGNGQASPDGGRPGWQHMFGQRSAPEQAAATPSESSAGRPPASPPARLPRPMTRLP